MNETTHFGVGEADKYIPMRPCKRLNTSSSTFKAVPDHDNDVPFNDTSPDAAHSSMY